MKKPEKCEIITKSALCVYVRARVRKMLRKENEEYSAVLETHTSKFTVSFYFI